MLGSTRRGITTSGTPAPEVVRRSPAHVPSTSPWGVVNRHVDGFPATFATFVRGTARPSAPVPDP